MLNRDRLIKKLTVKATITLTAEQDDLEIRGNCSAIDDETDAETERWILSELDSGNVWAWASVRVRASYGGFEAEDYLGGCSYASEKDFRKPGGYFDAMKRSAVEALADEIIRAETSIKGLEG